MTTSPTMHFIVPTVGILFDREAIREVMARLARVITLTPSSSADGIAAGPWLAPSYDHRMVSCTSR